METPEATVRLVYDLLCGPAELERDWETFRALFWPGATFIIARPSPGGEVDAGQWDVDDFIEAATAEYAEDGFWEREVWSRVDAWGNIAQVWSTYESRYGSEDAEVAGRGINAIQLVRFEGNWLITGVVFDIEELAGTIPDDYLG